ncbi:DUF3450 family protein [Pelagicoccus enzymogenes]|uniref:DUF3450 family protein n=1 Tax=Pelagicoccus enzymogenes TaxID=2773457 RepID=UPI00280ECC13|nr:DUF3450 family protein [Pelagicoccus enzymogenes]MDQ8197524.1 DUF3450 family protein [Pelagicoccus enzymogenes]
MLGLHTKTFKCLAAAATLSISATYSVSADVVKDTQNVLSEWISLEKQISEEKFAWVEQKEVIENSIEFMETEIASLKDIIKTAEETASAGEKKRAELDEKKEDLDEATQVMTAAVETYEKQIKQLSLTWPHAFRKSVETFLKRIPNEEQKETTPITIRLQNVVAIMSQFEKFQSVVTKDTGIQEVGGESREVTTLYFGFAYAYFVDGTGEYAGYGYPSSSKGWDWTPDAAIAEKVSQLVAIYDRTVDASFLGMPAKIVTP